MIHRVISVGRWVVDIVVSDKRYDIDGIVSLLYDIRIPKSIVNEAIDIMESENMDTGFICTNDKIMRAVIVVGNYSSGEEFLNTLSHEVHHLAVAIAKNVGVELDEELPAYINGDTIYDLASLVCEFGCPKCQNDKRL